VTHSARAASFLLLAASLVPALAGCAARPGPAFDPTAAAHSLAQEIVDGLLHPERAARLVSFHARDARNPSLDEVLGALVQATWGAPAAPRAGSAADDLAHRAAARRDIDRYLQRQDDRARPRPEAIPLPWP
jgi:hypothetical protein